MLELLKAIWRGWKGFVHKLVAAQSWVLMAFTYWTAMFPVAMWFRITGKDMLDRGPPDPDAESYGKAVDYPQQQDISRAQRPW